MSAAQPNPSDPGSAAPAPPRRGAAAAASLAAAVLPPKPNPIRELTNHFRAACDLLHHDGRAYAVEKSAAALDATSRLPPSGVAVPFGNELRREIVRVAARAYPTPPGRAAIDTVLQNLDALAFDGPEHPTALRFHHDPLDATVCVDLARPDGQVIVIDADGWHLDDPPPGVVFRRSHATKPLPTPVRGGRLDDLAGLLSLEPDDEVFRALLGWLVGLPFASAVRPGVLLVGAPGSGKSTRLRLATSVVEPSSPDALGAAFGRNADDDHVRAIHRAVPLFDNLTSVSGRNSDELCTLITGTARETRALYSNNELNTSAIKRAVGLTAVGVPAGFRSDALDRLIVLEVPPIADRVDDTALQAAFDRAHPWLLGALCDVVSAALRHLELVDAPGVHRMAAHTRVLAAIDQAVTVGDLDGCPHGLLDAYASVTSRARQQTASNDSFGSALLVLLEQTHGTWLGKASDLLAALSFHAPMNDRRGAGWPSSPRRVPEVLNHLRDGLAELGVTWTTTTVRGSTRYGFTWAQAPEPNPDQSIAGTTAHDTHAAGSATSWSAQ